MRIVPKEERLQRGCKYCLYTKIKKYVGTTKPGCSLNECPFHCLDKYQTYEEFMESEDCLIKVDEFFMTAAGARDLMNPGKPHRNFSDGDKMSHL